MIKYISKLMNLLKVFYVIHHGEQISLSNDDPKVYQKFAVISTNFVLLPDISKCSIFIQKIRYYENSVQKLPFH
jgi:hypothetical protein